MKPIRAITFDFWRTLFFAKQRARERFDARVRCIVQETGCPPDAVATAFEAVSAEFLHVHIREQRTLHPRAAIPMLCRELKCAIDAPCAARIVDALAEAFRLHPPEPIPGALDAIRAAADRVPVGIVSDTGMTPGSELRALLDRSGFGDHVRAFSFSDEVGVAKPQSAIFHHAAAALGVEPGSILHIGDLEPTDIAGALNVGAHAALFAGDNRRYVDGTQARYVYHAWPEFAAALPALLSGQGLHS